MTGGADALPTTAAELRDLILARYDSLSKRLQEVAQLVLDKPDDVALQTLTLLSEQTGAQPSAIVRFAKSLGFSGAGPMQRLLRESLLQTHTTLGYSERLRRFGAGLDDKVATSGAAALLDEFAEGNIMALRNLRETVSQDDLARAIELIRGAQTLYLIGMRRSFPVAAYLAYAFPQVGRRVMFVDGTGGLAAQQMGTIGPDDLLIAISYHSHAPETVAATEQALKAGAGLLAITDSLLSPIAQNATLTLQVRESEVRAFRSLSASICLAQTLAISLAYEEQRTGSRERS